ncbi:hypothetical protein SAMN05421505_1413 [Sinosporangium album]|uniref:DUF5753 domain-containing protein n=2 Tax=Sinosporangium album TaxID=504805 RepID=A0A1G8J5K3_9ACTN|nr:hypothetical protein SAMN05421505_1413 [Sinosporangium album]
MIAQLASGGDIVYLESPNGHAQVTNRVEDVKEIKFRYDSIRVEANPAHVSVAMIREAVQAWT